MVMEGDDSQQRSDRRHGSDRERPVDSVGIGGGANVVSMALVVRARSAVARAGGLCTEASTNRMAAEALINSLITTPPDVMPSARSRV